MCGHNLNGDLYSIWKFYEFNGNIPNKYSIWKPKAMIYLQGWATKKIQRFECYI